MKPGKYQFAAVRIAAWIFISAASIAAFPSLAAAPPGAKAAVYYYADAAGIFTLGPPPADTGYYLSLSGTFTQHELMLKIQKKNGTRRPRQVVYRMNGATDYNIKYGLKDGAGEYQIQVFGRKASSAMTYSGLCSFTVRSDGNAPEKSGTASINERILSYVDSVMGKTVKYGECWDLAQEALDSAGADWIRPFNYGALLDPESGEVKPGDIIQFRSVRITMKLPGGVTRHETLGNPDHTAVIYLVEGKKVFRLAHQNISGRRYVITSSIDLNIMTSGRYWIYRPVPGVIQ